MKYCEIAKNIYDDFYVNNTEDNLALDVSNYLCYFTENFPADIQENELIVGIGWQWIGVRTSTYPILAKNQGHFIADYKGVLAKRLEIRYTPKHGSWLNKTPFCLFCKMAIYTIFKSGNVRLRVI